MKLHYVSPAYARIWGRPVDELYQNPDASLQAVHPEDLDWVRPERTAMPPRDHDIEYRIRRPDGAVRWISDRAVVVRDSAGKAHRIVGIAEDITKRKQQQSELLQAQKMEVLGQLAGGITHDFNNLLMVVLGNAESLMARSRSAHLHPELEEIVVASRHAAALSKRLLRFSRRNDTQRDVVDLNQLIAETCRWLERTIGTQVEIELSLADGLWPVLADRSELQLTIVNLAVNARDAMPDGGSMSIATRNVVLDGGEHGRGRPRDFVAVSLRDTGTGMPVELQERIFEPFFTTKPAGQGTGLGLSIVRECVAECGGEIRVRSQPQRGTTFEIRLPRHDPATLSDYRRDGDGADRFRAAGES